MTYSDIITAFEPTILNVEDIDLLISATKKANFLIYGEIHGIIENAHVIYTLAHQLGFERIAVEVSPTIKPFVDAITKENYDFSLVDVGIFDASILSIEVAKTLGVLVREGTIRKLEYIDTYFDNPNRNPKDRVDSPQIREQILADNILALGDNMKTLCIMGQWHTQTELVELNNGHGVHKSALRRIREIKQDMPYSNSIYRSGRLYNDGREIDLPLNQQLPHKYNVTKVSTLDYKLNIPVATRIKLP